MKKTLRKLTRIHLNHGARYLVLSVLFALGLGTAAAHTVLWSEGFENYHTDTGQIWGGLDMNKVGSPNAAPKGGWNPWFGPNPNNGWVTQATTNPIPVEELVTPHSGQLMMRGARDANGWFNGADLDIDYVNIAYRFNGGAVFTNLFSIDWWFYDMLGNLYPGDPNQGPGCFGDHAGIVYAPGAQTTTDYDSTIPGDPSYQPSGMAPPLPFNGGQTARLAIGAFEEYGTFGAFDPTVYQVQVLGASDAQFDGGRYAGGWFNTTFARTNGWRHAAITVGPNNMAVFSIDDVVVLVHDAVAPDGFNLFNTTELQATPDTYNQSAYYDDITLSRITGPTITNTTVNGTTLTLQGKDGLVGWTYHVLAATDLSQPVSAWTPISTNVLTGTGPFSISVPNAVSAPKRFFSLRATVVPPAP